MKSDFFIVFTRTFEYAATNSSPHNNQKIKHPALISQWNENKNYLETSFLCILMVNTILHIYRAGYCLKVFDTRGFIQYLSFGTDTEIILFFVVVDILRNIKNINMFFFYKLFLLVNQRSQSSQMLNV